MLEQCSGKTAAAACAAGESRLSAVGRSNQWAAAGEAGSDVVRCTSSTTSGGEVGPRAEGEADAEWEEQGAAAAAAGPPLSAGGAAAGDTDVGEGPCGSDAGVARAAGGGGGAAGFVGGGFPGGGFETGWWGAASQASRAAGVSSDAEAMARTLDDWTGE